jgi:hypothetical protein
MALRALRFGRETWKADDGVQRCVIQRGPGGLRGRPYLPVSTVAFAK